MKFIFINSILLLTQIQKISGSNILTCDSIEYNTDKSVNFITNFGTLPSNYEADSYTLTPKNKATVNITIKENGKTKTSSREIETIDINLDENLERSSYFERNTRIIKSALENDSINSIINNLKPAGEITMVLKTEGDEMDLNLVFPVTKVNVQSSLNTKLKSGNIDNITFDKDDLKLMANIRKAYQHQNEDFKIFKIDEYFKMNFNQQPFIFIKDTGEQKNAFLYMKSIPISLQDYNMLKYKEVMSKSTKSRLTKSGLDSENSGVCKVYKNKEENQEEASSLSQKQLIIIICSSVAGLLLLIVVIVCMKKKCCSSDIQNNNSQSYKSYKHKSQKERNETHQALVDEFNE